MEETLKSQRIRKKLEDESSNWPHLELEVTGSAEKVLNEMRDIDNKELGSTYIWGVGGNAVEDAGEWANYRIALVQGLGEDENYDISFDEIDDLDMMLGRGQYDRVERILDEEYATSEVLA